MKKLLLALAAALGIGSLAYGAALTPLTGPQDPSQLNATINQLMQSIQSGVNGIVYSAPQTVTSTATTVEQNLVAALIPANTLNRAGQSLRLRCAGVNAAGNGTVKLYYGTSSVSLTANSTNQSWDLGLLVAYNASATSAKYVGTGVFNATAATTVATQNIVDNMASALTAKCTATSATASAGNFLLMNFLVEQIK